MGWRPVVNRWLASPGGDIAPGVPWFDEDIRGEPNRSVVMGIGIAPDGPTRVDLVITLDGITKIIQLNDGTLVGADDFFQVNFIVPPGARFNMTHETGTNNPAVVINKEVAD